MTKDRKLAGRAIWNWLDDRDLTQGWLARRLNVSQSTLSGVMRGEFDASPELADRLEHVTGVRAERFCGKGVNRIAKRRARATKAAVEAAYLERQASDVVEVGGGR